MDKETIIYLDGFADGLNMANNSTNKMLDKISAEIKGLKRFEIRGEKTPLINGDNVLHIINKYREDSVPQERSK